RVGRCISRGALPKRAQRPPQVHTDAFQTPRQIALTSIAVVRSPYKERFGCPRQPSVTKGVLGAKAADCTLEFLPENIGSQEKIRFALQDLEGFEVIWVPKRKDLADRTGFEMDWGL
ncbi:Putative tRNA (Adenine(37)-N6)-methyltransferase, partial [Durusdinium trenchii]